MIRDERMRRLVAELTGRYTEFEKPEQTIKANLHARRSAQREGGRELGYGAQS
jgi:hypothetical protein